MDKTPRKREPFDFGPQFRESEISEIHTQPQSRTHVQWFAAACTVRLLITKATCHWPAPGF